MLEHASSDKTLPKPYNAYSRKMKLPKTELSLVIGSLAATCLIAEIMIRILMSPSTMSTGVLFGREIPPMRIAPSDLAIVKSASSRHLEQYGEMAINGIALTRGDLFGVMREDREVAYVPLENTESKNGWWKSNNLGARKDSPTEYLPHPNQSRTLLFGDSYTQGSRVKQDQTFAEIWNRLDPEQEYLNFGVDGYSSGQSFLRYQQVKEQLHFDEVILTLVPTADLWRDLSVSRYFGGGWISYKLQPRFYLENGRLKQAKSPFRDLAAQLQDAPEFQVSRSHLLRHDRFYFQEYEPSPLTDFSVSIGVAKAAIAIIKRKLIYRNIRSPTGEAVKVTSAVIEAMKSDVLERGAAFSLVILPTFHDILEFKSKAEFRDEWRLMSDALCRNVNCIRTMERLIEHKSSELDFGYDGTHYGPNANRIIAKILNSHR